MIFGTDPKLDAVTGDEALAAQYAQFFRWFVMRKRQELMNPRFLPISEISLPRMSLVHYFPNNTLEIGPSRSEAFISNFQGDIFLDFVSDYNPVMGNGRKLVIEIRKAIQAYRASHYNYNWTKDINTVYRKERNLIVKSYGLLDKLWNQRPGIFVNFERYYNHFDALMKGINEEAARGDRHQFMRIDLPINFPGWTEMLVDYDHYIAKFNTEKGLPVPSNQTVRLTKAEGSYWLIDLMAMLFGDYEYSQFNKLTEAAQKALHVVFVFDSRCLVIHYATIKEWLDNEFDKRYLEKQSKEQKDLAEGQVAKKDSKSHRLGHQKRLNATKRFYLALMTLSRGGVIEPEREDDNGTETKDPALAEGAAGTAEGEGSTPPSDRQETIDDSARPVAAPRTGNPLLDVLSEPEGSVEPLEEAAGDSGIGTDLATDQEWNSEVDDKLLEQEQASAEVSTKKDPFSTPAAGVQLALDQRAREGNLSVAEHAFFMRKGTQYQHVEMDNGQTLEEFMRVTPEELKELKNDAKIEANFTTILDESMLQSRAKVLKQGYAKKFMLKDMVHMLVGIQNAGIALNNFKHEVVNSVEGRYGILSVQFHPVNGEQSTHVIRYPMVEDDGTFMVDGVKSHMQLQRRERPIRKINRWKVALSSYYDIRLMVTRSQKVVDDMGLWLAKQILLRGQEGVLEFNRGSKFNQNYQAPRIYSAIATKFQWIKVDEFTFDFRIDKLLEENPSFKKHLKKDDFLVGVHNGNPLTMDSYGNVYNGGVEVGTIEGLMGINTTKAPIEYASINIGGYPFPIGVVLCYYFGIDKLLSVTKATTRSVPNGTRPKLTEDEYMISFNDEHLIFNRREKFASMIFGGLVKLNNISNFSKSDLNNNGVWGPLMADPKVKTKHFREMKNLFDLFIDPITKVELQKLGHADSFHYLLLDAVEMLETDYTRHEVELEEQRIVGYERFAGHIYAEWCKSVRMYRNKGNDRKHKLEFNPDAVVMKIITDTSVNLVEEVNPIHQLKDQEEVTFGGTGGRSEITMVQRARVQLDSYRGVISEANKDSGKVGYVTYTTSDPLLEDYRGNLALKEKPSLTSLSSVTGNLAASITKDDTKRAVYVSTQWSQAATAKNYTWNITRTGYDSIIPHRTSELYSKVAREDGKVTEVSNDQLTVTYSDGTVDKYPLGLVIGEASGEHHRHTRVTDLKVGDKFKKGDVIGFDEEWFARDPFNPGQAVLKVGYMARIALLENQDTYEDSIAVSQRIAGTSITPYLNDARFSMQANQGVLMHVKVGDEIDYDAILCEIEDSHVMGGFSEGNHVASDINRLGIRQIRSKYHGKVIKVDVKYNAPAEDMSESVKKLITKADKERKRTMETEGKDPVTGAVNNNLNVAKPVIPPGMLVVTIYIESLDGSTTADKYVVGNQMKGTAGTIMEFPLTTRDGREVDMMISFKGMFNRMVLSLRDKIGMNELTSNFSKLAVKVYRGEK